MTASVFALTMIAVTVGGQDVKHRPATHPAPAALIANARKQTDWIFKIRRLEMQVRHKTVRTKALLKDERSRFRRQHKDDFDDMDAAIAARPFLQAEEIAFESTVWMPGKYYHQMKGKRSNSTVTWDGKLGLAQDGWFDPKKAASWRRCRGGSIGDLAAFGYFFSVLPEEWVRGLDLGDIGTLKRRRQQKQPAVEDFRYLGRAVFHGFDCHFVWLLDGSNNAIVIDAATGRYRGHRYLAMAFDEPKRRDELWVECVHEHFASQGKVMGKDSARTVLKDRQSADYKASVVLMQTKRQELVTTAGLADTRPTQDLVVLKEREVKPRCWFPKRERYVVYDQGQSVRQSSTRDVFRLKVDQPIEDQSIFSPVIPDGADIQDVRPRKPRKP